MARRLFDLTLAVTGLILAAPLLMLAVIGIRVAGPGPLVYRASRVGRGGKEFTLYKFRTMRQGAEADGPITGTRDPRVYPFGDWLRRWKLDELPQLINVLRGEMSIVGPRPEDPAIVSSFYTEDHRETLNVLPGLASPGSIYNYTHGEQFLSNGNVTCAYAERLLPIKLGLDSVYVRHASLAYDVRIIARTAAVLLARAFGRREFSDPPEMRHLHRAVTAGVSPGLVSHDRSTRAG